MTLKEAVELQKEPLLQSLAESIRIRSVQEPPADGAPYGPNVRKCLDHALAVSKGLGFRTTDLDHQMGWCEFGEGDEMIAVLGHLDVVPEGEGWTFDPFGGEIRDGKISAVVPWMTKVRQWPPFTRWPPCVTAVSP